MRLTRLAKLDDATAMATRAGDDGIYVTERDGRVMVVRDGKATLLLDDEKRTDAGHEQGMLGLDFSPDGQRLYVYYIGEGDEHSYLDEFAMDGRTIDRRSRRRVLFVEQPESNVHKGGQVAFGPDGMLYLGLGDGGPSDVPPSTSQRLDTLLGKIVRIDPRRGKRYAIPRGNPFADRKNALPEIYAYGLRNPWRFSFDRDTGDLWIGDVGRYVFEEINRVGARDAAGANFGWPFFEGTSPLQGTPPDDVVAPLHTYAHTDRCAVIGGYVYRGTAIPKLRGAYVYGDFCDGTLRALVRRGGKVVAERELGVDVPAMTSLGEDENGELYVLSLTEGLSRLDRRR
ncbi:MAG: PQQ-dependent sugar dehydrogenase [Actinomycetota bacterium]|nr:PQQ-dependent sugar dehydrogenase [Actinomycetota bacterium]